MIQLYLNCGGMEKMVACIPLFLKHFVHICVRVMSIRGHPEIGI